MGKKHIKMRAILVIILYVMYGAVCEVYGAVCSQLIYH